MKTLTLTATALSLAMGTGVAFASFATGDQMGTTEEEVRAALEAKGAVIEEIETEDNMIEAEFTMNGIEMEIEIDPATGAIVEVENDDEESDEEDD